MEAESKPDSEPVNQIAINWRKVPQIGDYGKL